jgi:hypothetical protein
MIDTRKATSLLFCAPAWEAVQTVEISEPKRKRFPLLVHVRIALASIRSTEEKYNKTISYFHGGSITGGITGDKLFLAQQVVAWEAAAERPSLNAALTAGDIKLTAVANSIVNELRRTLFTIERGIITGQLTHTE